MYNNNVIGESLLVNDLPKIILEMCKSLAKIEGLLTEQAKTEKPNNPTELLTAEDTCDFLHIALPTLYSKVCKGEIASIKRGRRLLFYKRDLIAYLEAGRRRSNTEIKEDTINRFANKKRISNVK